MLRELRGALSAERHILQTGIGWVGLDPDRLRINLSPVYDAGGGPTEFAADIDIPDPEFESWLRDMRLRLTPEEDAAPPRRTEPGEVGVGAYLVALAPVQGNDTRAHLVGEMIVNEAAARACEMIPATLADRAEPRALALIGVQMLPSCYAYRRHGSAMRWARWNWRRPPAAPTRTVSWPVTRWPRR